MLRKVAVGLAALGALSAAQVKALGLGEVTVHSSLNQPLNAEIDLLQIRDLSSSQIIAGLADADEFYLAGVRPTAVLSDLSFELELSGSGGKLKLKTREPIREPFLNFLVEVNWPTGRLVKEYTLLLDPPVFSAQDLAPKTRPVAPRTVRSEAPMATVQPAIMAPAPAATVVAATATMPSEYFVGKNDTLWNIALKTRPGRSVSPQQMMLAIQKANPDAFIGNNINRLKSGVVLTIPNADEIAALNSPNTLKEISRQNKAWRSQGAPAQAAAAPKSVQLDASKQTAVTSEAAKPEQSQLRIVSSEKESGPKESEDRTLSSDTSEATPVQEELLSKNRELEEQLVVTLEGLDKVERDNAELFSRLERISDQMESMQRLLQLKDDQLAQMQQRLAASQQAASVAVPQVETPSETSGDLMQTLTSLPVLGGIGAGVLAMLGGAFWFMRKRKQGAEDEERAVEEAMAILDAQETEGAASEKASSADKAPAPAPAPEMMAAADALDAVQDDIHIEEDPNDPFNAVSDIDDKELDALDIANDLDMDLKLDEPVADDLDLDQFADSLLSDEEFDLSVESDDGAPNAMSSADEDNAASSLEDDLEAILAGEDPKAEELLNDDDDDDLDALLAGGDDFEVAEESLTESDDALDDLDALLADESMSDDLDALLAEESSSDDLAELEPEGIEVDSVGEDADVVSEDELEALLASATGEDVATGTDEVDGAEVVDDALDSDDLDALLAEAEDSSESLEPEFSVDTTSNKADEDFLELDNFDDAESELDRLMAEEAGASDESALDQELEALIGEEDAKLESLALDPVAAPEDEDFDEDETLKALLAGTEEDAPAAVELEADELDLEDALGGIELDENVTDFDSASAESAEESVTEVDEPAQVTTLSLEDDELEDDLKLGELLQDEPSAEPSQDDVVAEITTLEIDEGSDIDPEIDAAADALLEGLPTQDDEGENLESLLAEIEAGGLSDGDEDGVQSSADIADENSAFDALSLELESDFDKLDDEDLEAQLGQVLEEEGSDFALEESALEDGLDYLEDADEVATKLDLARAYVDMEDREGAVDILTEVLSEGNDEQKAEAQQMMDSLKS